MKRETPPTARLEARLPHEVMARLKRAAEIQGRTLAEFVVAAADEATCRAIQETEIVGLSIEGQREIAAAILHPPEPRPLSRGLRRGIESCSGWTDRFEVLGTWPRVRYGREKTHGQDDSQVHQL
jgi:uncharacterized protein (DUF1778 family)